VDRGIIMNERELFEEWLEQCPIKYSCDLVRCDFTDYRFYFREYFNPDEEVEE